MVNRVKPPDEVVTYWADRLATAQEAVVRVEAQRFDVLDVRDDLICEAFDAGLAAPKIREVTGLSIARLYQIYQSRGGEAARQSAAQGNRKKGA
jgi:hypothetical protein